MAVKTAAELSQPCISTETDCNNSDLDKHIAECKAAGCNPTALQLMRRLGFVSIPNRLLATWLSTSIAYLYETPAILTMALSTRVNCIYTIGSESLH